jgi:hypothetical protein
VPVSLPTGTVVKVENCHAYSLRQLSSEKVTNDIVCFSCGTVKNVVYLQLTNVNVCSVCMGVLRLECPLATTTKTFALARFNIKEIRHLDNVPYMTIKLTQTNKDLRVLMPGLDQHARAVQVVPALHSVMHGEQMLWQRQASPEMAYNDLVREALCEFSVHPIISVTSRYTSQSLRLKLIGAPPLFIAAVC